MQRSYIFPSHQFPVRSDAVINGSTIERVIQVLLDNGPKQATTFYPTGYPAAMTHMETIDTINSRKSIRRFLDTPVEKEKIQALLEAAIRAPSAMNKQCWRFVAVTDKETIAQLAKCNMVFNSWLKDAPAVIVALADPKESTDMDDLPYYMWDAALAMHTLVLAATDIGLGTCYLAAYNEAKVKDLLGIPDELRVVCMTPLGYPTERRSVGERLMKAMAGSSKRKPVDEVAHWEKW